MLRNRPSPVGLRKHRYPDGVQVQVRNGTLPSEPYDTLYVLIAPLRKGSCHEVTEGSNVAASYIVGSA